MKRTVFTTLSAAIFFLFCSSVIYAQHMGSGMMGSGTTGSEHGMGPGMTGGQWNPMTPEQQKEYEQMRVKFYKDTLQLRQEISSKQMELHTLWQEENPDQGKLKNLSNEVADLESQLLKKRNEFLIQSRGKFGDQAWSCPGGYGTCSGMMGQGYGYGMGPGMMGYGMMGGMMGPGYNMGPGMMGRGYGMGPGMMGGGYGMGPGMMYGGRGMGSQYGSGNPYYKSQQLQKPLDEKNARQLVDNYLNSTNNPNLKLGKITDKGENFEAQILTKDGSLVNEILVDKNTGWMRSAY